MQEDFATHSHTVLLKLLNDLLFGPKWLFLFEKSQKRSKVL